MTSIKILAIIPPKDFLNPAKYLKAIENAGNETAKAVKVDFMVTTKTWSTQPDFRIDHSPNSNMWKISTDNKIYGYVNSGTPPHIITPKNAPMLAFNRSGFRPKSRTGWIGSNKGARASKDLTFAKTVHHPGTQARDFAKTIKKKWDREWPRQVDRAIRAVNRYG